MGQDRGFFNIVLGDAVPMELGLGWRVHERGRFEMSGAR